MGPSGLCQPSCRPALFSDSRAARALPKPSVPRAKDHSCRETAHQIRPSLHHQCTISSRCQRCRRRCKGKNMQRIGQIPRRNKRLRLGRSQGENCNLNKKSPKHRSESQLPANQDREDGQKTGQSIVSGGCQPCQIHTRSCAQSTGTG